MKSGFSLVELSIVLVILGLLTGGILSGQSLIRAAEMRSINSDYQRYHAAVMTFRDKYRALPGDMNNAVKFWGAAAGATTDGVDTTCQALTTASTDSRTCNGNGNGSVDGVEWFRGWQHLANAGLVEGTFTGVANSGGASLAIPGENVPLARLANIGHTYMSVAAHTNHTGSWFDTVGGLILSTGRALTFNETRGGFLKPEEAWNLDTKLDDGRPSYGKLMANNNASCTTTNVTATAEYDLTGTGNTCMLRYFIK